MYTRLHLQCSEILRNNNLIFLLVKNANQLIKNNIYNLFSLS